MIENLPLPANYRLVFGNLAWFSITLALLLACFLLWTCTFGRRRPVSTTLRAIVILGDTRSMTHIFPCLRRLLGTVNIDQIMPHLVFGPLTQAFNEACSVKLFFGGCQRPSNRASPTLSGVGSASFKRSSKRRLLARE